MLSLLELELVAFPILYLGLYLLLIIVVFGVLLFQPFVSDLLDLGDPFLLLLLCLRPYLMCLVSLVHYLYNLVCPCSLARKFPVPGLQAIEAIDEGKGQADAFAQEVGDVEVLVDLPAH